MKVGIYCQNRDALRECCFVSEVTLLEPEEAIRQGYYPSESAIVPGTPPRPATDAELDRFVANETTDRLMQLWRIPRELGNLILQGCLTCKDPRNAPREEILPGVYGRYRPHTPSPSGGQEPGRLTTSANGAIINTVTNQPSRVGLHIDVTASSTTSLFMNTGPGYRYHIVTPDFNTDTVPDGQIRPERIAYMEAYRQRRERPPDDTPPFLAYWLRVDPPTADYFMAVVGVRVGEVLHDGLTYGCTERSAMVACHIEPVGRDFRSTLVR